MEPGLFPRCFGPIVDPFLEIRWAWPRPSADFDPERERRARGHIGDRARFTTRISRAHDVAGGPITRKRLEAELDSLRKSQTLPWAESDPEHGCALVDDALAAHARAGTEPPSGFSSWRALFAARPARDAGGAEAPAGGEADPALVERSATLLELPELAGWFVDPALVQEDAVALLEMKDSRLVVSDQVKAQREAAIVDRAVEKAFTGAARHRWARRLGEMALIFRATSREEPARLALAAAAALGEAARPAESIALVRALAARGLELGGEVALGRGKTEEVSRRPRPAGSPRREADTA